MRKENTPAELDPAQLDEVRLDDPPQRMDGADVEKTEKTSGQAQHEQDEATGKRTVDNEERADIDEKQERTEGDERPGNVERAQNLQKDIDDKSKNVKSAQDVESPQNLQKDSEENVNSSQDVERPQKIDKESKDKSENAESAQNVEKPPNQQTEKSENATRVQNGERPESIGRAREDGARGRPQPPSNNPFDEDRDSGVDEHDDGAPPRPALPPPSTNYGLLEGMDPETGDYIRPSRLDLEKQRNAQKAGDESDDDDDQEEGDRKERRSKMGKRRRGKKKQLRRSRSLSRRVLDTVSNKSRTDDENEDEDPGLFGNSIRFTIMIISTLCLSSILSNILTFNFTFICMSGDKPPNYENLTEAQKLASGYKPHLDYTSGQRSALFMSVAIGALVAVFPMTVALNKYGSRMTFGVLGLISAVATFLVPLAANTAFALMLAARAVQGVGFSACLPVMGSITSHWSTLKQNGIFIAILSSFLQVAPIFTMPLAGELCTSSLGWESVYYLHAVVCLLLFTIFVLYHRNSPHKHPMMNRREIVKVYFGKGSIYGGAAGESAAARKSKRVPYRAMYTDSAIWAILVAAFGNFMGTQLSLQFIPTYLNKVLFLPIEQTGVVSAISPVIMFIIKLIAGQSSDKITFISDEWKLRIYNCLSCGMMGVLFILLASLDPRSNESLCLIVLIAATCILGFNSGGFFKSSQLVSRQHSHFTLANIAFLNCVCMLVVPLLNELVAPENAPEDWAVVLWVHGVLLLLTNAVFCVWCSARPARWTMEGWQHRASRHTRRSVKRPGAVGPAPAQPVPPV